MNREQEAKKILRLIQDMPDNVELYEAIVKVLDAAYHEGYRQCREDRNET